LKDLIAEFEDSLKPYQLKISKIPPNKPEGTKLFVVIWFPLKDPKPDGSFMMSKDEIALISWAIFPFSNSGRKVIDHFSALPYGSIPDHHIDFFKHFILHLEDKWVRLCDQGEEDLADWVSRILRIPLN
jgi:hypothetical protein